MNGEDREQHSHEAAQKRAHSREHMHTHEHTHTHDHVHSHAHGYVHDDKGPAHTHSHRNIIGFDKHGVLAAIVKADHQGEQDENEFIRGYINAITEYKKTSPSEQGVIDNTPDSAVREMLLRAEQLGFGTTLDRFDKQKPQCSFGLVGVCCKICNMGPCKIMPKNPKGICGTGVDLIAMRNLLRSAAADVAQRGMHDREVTLPFKWAVKEELDLLTLGQQKIRDTVRVLGIKIKRESIKRVASGLADKLLEDMSRTVPDDYEVIKACAPAECRKVWKDLDITPINTYHEVFRAYRRSGVGTNGDWRSTMQQFLRCDLVFTFSGVVSTAITIDSLFDVGDHVTSKINIGTLKKSYMSIAVHGHLPAPVSQTIEVGQEGKFIEPTKKVSAKGIRFYDICCSGFSAMYRYAGAILLDSTISAKLVLGTGALDLQITDVQDVSPSIMEIAKHFQTTITTTSESVCLPGAERSEYDHHHLDIGETRELAERIVKRTIKGSKNRKGVPVCIPPYEVDAEIGFSVEYVHRCFGSMAPFTEAVKSGKILGIVSTVGCNNPKILHEKTALDAADILLQNNILTLTNGCIFFLLVKTGYCNMKNGLPKAGEPLRDFLLPDLSLVQYVDECIDNTRSSGVFTDTANEFSRDLKDMPFAFISLEWNNEKGIGTSLGFRLMGINSYHCVEAQIHGSKNVVGLLEEGTRETLGSIMYVDADPEALAEKPVKDIGARRHALGWVVPGDKHKAIAPQTAYNLRRSYDRRVSKQLPENVS